MPVRINLLAESQALEEMRRRDPVKRAIWIGALLGALVLAYSLYLQSKALVAQSEVRHLETRLRSNTNEYQQVLEHKRRLDDANAKLAKLLQLATNRFLEGSLLDALQHATVDEVQLTRLKIENDYALVEETKQKTNSDGLVISRAKPATSTERIKVTLEGRDNSDGEQAIKYRGAIAENPFFQALLGRTNEVKMVSVNSQGGGEAKKFALFTLECRFPEKTR